MIDEAKITKLVEQELKKILSAESIVANTDSVAKPISEKQLILIYTGTEIGFHESIEQIKKLKQKGYEFNLALSRQALNQLGRNNIMDLTGISTIIPELDAPAIIELLKEYQGILIGTLSRNTALKISYGITDSFITYLTFLGIISKKAVVAARNGVDPSMAEKMQWHLPALPNDLISTILAQLQKLERWGMKLVEANQLAIEMDKAVKQSTGNIDKIDEMTPYGTERPLITEREIKEAAKKGIKKIILEQNTIITPLARDIAKQLDINIE